MEDRWSEALGLAGFSYVLYDGEEGAAMTPEDHRDETTFEVTYSKHAPMSALRLVSPLSKAKAKPPYA